MATRCPIGVQCNTAGNAGIAVTVAQDGSPPATLGLNTAEGPADGRWLS